MPKQVRHDKCVIVSHAMKQVQGFEFQNLILNSFIWHLGFEIWI